MGYLENIAKKTVVLLSAMVLLSSCAQWQKNFKNDRPAPVKKVASAPSSKTQPISASDKIAAFLMSARSGDRKTIATGSSKNVTVVAGPQYISAQGLTCRHANLVNGKGETLVSAACLSGSKWATVIKP